MWYEIFKFELNYRIRRPETYLFFIFLLLFSIVGDVFIFQGIEMGLMKWNAPLVIAKTMGAITGIFMIMVSMIMGVPVLRDYQYQTEALMFVNPISKRDYLLGRFLGSFSILVFIFSGLLIGMMIGSQMPWHTKETMVAFNALTYIQSFVVVVLPSLFFGACTFFVTGMLSKKLLVVYTQGIVLFVVFLLTKSITNAYWQGIFDPFSLTTLTQFTKHWSINELNTTGITFSGILLHNKLFWMILGWIVLLLGYRKFSFSMLAKKVKGKSKRAETTINREFKNQIAPNFHINHSLKSKWYQLFELSKFYTLSLLKEASFWGIIICGIIIIVINSVNLGTVYGVDSYPATHFIISELQEMSMYFFLIILLFYSGEIIWKERSINQYGLNDATPISSLINLTSKFIAMNTIYIVLIVSLILTGILFQIASGYYQFKIGVYFSGFFIEILPFLTLYTFAAFFFHSISKNKFIGIFLTLFFFIVIGGLEALGFNHSLYKFGGNPLGIYSEMNGYGHFLKPYLWIKTYWLVFGVILLIISALIIQRGQERSFWKRITTIKRRITKPITYLGFTSIGIFIFLGSYVFYNTNILNPNWVNSQELNFRADYETTLKPLEYFPQPKIVDVKLDIELYPKKRSYEIKGSYILENTTDKPIREIHIQKLIASHVDLKEVTFEGGATLNSKYQEFDYSIYTLSKLLLPKKTIKVNFKQVYQPLGFKDNNSSTQFVNNGTFFNNGILPSLGYNRDYEINNSDERSKLKLPIRYYKAKIDNSEELMNARSGGDSDGIHLEVVIGTHQDQTAVTAGKLIDKWTKNNRNYFHYKTDQRIINFYSIVSAKYEVMKEQWIGTNTALKPVDLEIYYHAAHTYNLDRMMKGMKASLSYFSTHFSPYQYEQLRIMEFPRYKEFAQSFPNTIPFSEALGFVLDIDDETDVDMAFYITAHEIAHQWFGMQIQAANVQGKNFVLETLAQYGAIMVLKEFYSEEKVLQFLALQKEDYDKKSKKAVSESSLSMVENQDFVYYNKGAIAMYKLQKMIGEKQVNLALQRFINDWHSYKGVIKMQTEKYATSKDLLGYFKGVTPQHLQYVIGDLFETTNADVLKIIEQDSFF
ncbi:Peptidase family M1 [Tenacibaculum sp. MAR_2009_124]|uniref:M1 family aminopeptidase n=1 Tax=Tenacibaculum sp. MAR_2009_124 TaxID=1250059 RepID=UPI00089CF5D8|nr:M1 family aminopeptidase [Tenacibaculum sp. MAR_2009_124]SEB46535.1 Peptidase family M1 [Tenacibaculum sp. MAR_2009_124]